jgi:ethanolaminephosphotransferase
MVFISPIGLKNLLSYKYVSSPMSPFCRLMDVILWDRCAKSLPLWLAPNAVTIISSLSIVITTAVLCFYSGLDMTTRPDLSILMLATAGYFVYNVLDVCDGRQARRLKVSSPLGQLLDHGLDGSVNTLSIALINIVMLSATDSFSAICIVLWVQGVFFFAAWNEHYCGVLKYQLFGLGVHEFSHFNYAHLLWTYFKGYDFWQQPAYFGLLWKDMWLIYLGLV